MLDRAGRYVLDYEEKFQNIVAEESYTQWTTPLRTTATALTVSCAATSCKRTTRADVVFVRLAGAIPWGCFRDVYESDGTKVRRFEPARARAYVATEYVPDAKLALWVPFEMREEYDDLPGAMPRLFGTPSEATARYSNFRRFSVSIDDEQATLPKE